MFSSAMAPFAADATRDLRRFSPAEEISPRLIERLR